MHTPTARVSERMLPYALGRHHTASPRRNVRVFDGNLEAWFPVANGSRDDCATFVPVLCQRALIMTDAPNRAFRWDLPRLLDEPVPSAAALIDDVVVVLEDAVRQPVVPHELPEVLDWVQFRPPRRQKHQGDVVRHLQLRRDVPSGLVENEHGMCSGIDGVADKVFLHRLCRNREGRDQHPCPSSGRSRRRCRPTSCADHAVISGIPQTATERGPCAANAPCTAGIGRFQRFSPAPAVARRSASRVHPVLFR